VLSETSILEADRSTELRIAYGGASSLVLLRGRKPQAAVALAMGMTESGSGSASAPIVDLLGAPVVATANAI